MCKNMSLVFCEVTDVEDHEDKDHKNIHDLPDVMVEVYCQIMVSFYHVHVILLCIQYLHVGNTVRHSSSPLLTLGIMVLT